MVILTEQRIRARTKINTANIPQTTTLGLSGIKLDEKEKISLLGKSLRGFSALRDLDLSHNQLESLDGLESLQKLTTLNLYFNNIRNLAEVTKLKANKRLKELDLRLNPVNKLNPDNRLFIIYSIPSLEILDDKEIKDSERRLAYEKFGQSRKSQTNDSFDEETESVATLRTRLKAISEPVKTEILNSSLKKNTIESLYHHEHDFSDHELPYKNSHYIATTAKKGNKLERSNYTISTSMKQPLVDDHDDLLLPKASTPTGSRIATPTLFSTNILNGASPIERNSKSSIQGDDFDDYHFDQQQQKSNGYRGKINSNNNNSNGNNTHRVAFSQNILNHDRGRTLPPYNELSKNLALDAEQALELDKQVLSGKFEEDIIDNHDHHVNNASLEEGDLSTDHEENEVDILLEQLFTLMMDTNKGSNNIVNQLQKNDQFKEQAVKRISEWFNTTLETIYPSEKMQEINEFISDITQQVQEIEKVKYDSEQQVISLQEQLRRLQEENNSLKKQIHDHESNPPQPETPTEEVIRMLKESHKQLVLSNQQLLSEINEWKKQTQ